jgi:transcriptional regulator GlxA family with amidase domain
MRPHYIAHDDVTPDAWVFGLGGLITKAIRGDGLLPGNQISLPVQIEGKLGRLVVSVDAFEEVPSFQRRRRTRELSHRQLQCAYDAIQSSHAEPLRLSTIAAKVGLSPSRFSRSFHASAGVPFTSYLRGVRLDSAMRLMRATNKPLCDIALACGFGDQSQFSRSFVRTIGITPLKWRRLQHAATSPTD